jgi:hypothetical protein
LHPGSRVLIYVLAALVLPGLSFFWMTLSWVAALAAIAWMGRYPLKLIWRTRWLLLILVLGYGFSVPGESVWAPLGEWAPSWPGLALGVERAAHLMALLLWLDVLVLSLSTEQTLSGLHALMQPLRMLNVDIRPIALRLALTLKAIENLERGNAVQNGGPLGKHRGNLRRLFDSEPDAYIPERVTLQKHPIQILDVLLPMLLLAGALGIWLNTWAGAWGTP